MAGPPRNLSEIGNSGYIRISSSVVWTRDRGLYKGLRIRLVLQQAPTNTIVLIVHGGADIADTDLSPLSEY